MNPTLINESLLRLDIRIFVEKIHKINTRTFSKERYLTDAAAKKIIRALERFANHYQREGLEELLLNQKVVNDKNNITLLQQLLLFKNPTMTEQLFKLMADNNISQEKIAIRVTWTCVESIQIMFEQQSFQEKPDEMFEIWKSKYTKNWMIALFLKEFAKNNMLDTREKQLLSLKTVIKHGMNHSIEPILRSMVGTDDIDLGNLKLSDSLKKSLSDGGVLDACVEGLNYDAYRIFVPSVLEPIDLNTYHTYRSNNKSESSYKAPAFFRFANQLLEIDARVPSIIYRNVNGDINKLPALKFLLHVDRMIDDQRHVQLFRERVTIRLLQSIEICPHCALLQAWIKKGKMDAWISTSSTEGKLLQLLNNLISAESYHILKAIYHRSCALSLNKSAQESPQESVKKHVTTLIAFRISAFARHQGLYNDIDRGVCIAKILSFRIDDCAEHYHLYHNELLALSPTLLGTVFRHNPRLLCSKWVLEIINAPSTFPQFEKKMIAQAEHRQDKIISGIANIFTHEFSYEKKEVPTHPDNWVALFDQLHLHIEESTLRSKLYAPLFELLKESNMLEECASYFKQKIDNYDFQNILEQHVNGASSQATLLMSPTQPENTAASTSMSELSQQRGTHTRRRGKRGR